MQKNTTSIRNIPPAVAPIATARVCVPPPLGGTFSVTDVGVDSERGRTDSCGFLVSLTSVVPSDTKGVVLLVDEDESTGCSVLTVRPKESPLLKEVVALIVLVLVSALKVSLEVICSTLDGKTGPG